MIRLLAHSLLLAMAACVSVSACAAGSSQDYRPGVGVEVDGCRLSRNVSASTTYLYVDETRVVVRGSCVGRQGFDFSLDGVTLQSGALAAMYEFDLSTGIRRELPQFCDYDSQHAQLMQHQRDIYLSRPRAGGITRAPSFTILEDGNILAHCPSSAYFSRPDGEYQALTFGLLRQTGNGWINANEYAFVAIRVAPPGTPPVINRRNLGPASWAAFEAMNTHSLAIIRRGPSDYLDDPYHHLARVEPGELVFAEPVDWWPILDCPDEWRRHADACRPQGMFFDPATGDLVVNGRLNHEIPVNRELIIASSDGGEFRSRLTMPISDVHRGYIRSVSGGWILVDSFRNGLRFGDTAFVSEDESRVITIEHSGGDDHNIVAGLASPDGRYGIVKRRDGRVMVFDLDQPDGTRLTHRDAIQSWRASRYGQLVVSGTGRISQFDGLELDYVGQIRGQ